MAAGLKKKDENNDHILYNLLVHAEWNLDEEIQSKSGLDILQQRGSFGKKLLSIVEGSVWGVWKIIKYPFSGFAASCILPEELLKLHETSQSWDFALSSEGNFVAVLQEQCIEIRSSRDNFSSVISKCQVHKDPFLSWRRLAWSSDSSLLAFAHSWGEVVVFDLSGTSLCTLKNNVSSNTGGLFHHCKSISGLLFLEKDQNNESELELLVISYQGQLDSYIINSHSGEHSKKCSFSFQSVLPHGVSCAVYYPPTKLLLLGTPATRVKGKSALGNGITLWRLLSGQPHFKLIEDQALEIKKIQQATGLVGKLFPRRFNNRQHGVWKMSLALDGKTLLALHFSGRLSLWELPSLKQRETWEQTEQPEYKSEDVHVQFPSLNHSKRKVEQNNFVYDIGWWSNEAIVLARRSGALTVSSFDKSLKNILGQYAEWCEPCPLVTSAHNGGFLILECENNVVSLSPVRKTVDDEGEQGEHRDDEDDEEHHMVTKTRELAKHVLYFLTESERFRPPVRRPKILKQTYRLLCLRSTTPEELYARKIELEEYGEALALAQSYDLDCDLVYQKQWRKSKVTLSSIHDYLSKVTKRVWVLHECLERVAEDLESTKALLKYGLHGTGLHVLVAMGDTEHPFLIEENEEDEVEERDEQETEKKLLKKIDFNKLSVEQRNICRYRLRFLTYCDRLSTYETILGGPAVAHDNFDSVFFTSFRDSNIVESSVNFARDNDWNAVDCLLTYHGKQTLPHYLSILSNFPETTSPFDYRSLLPEAGIDDDEPEVYEWEEKTWRTQDWVENPRYLKTYKDDTVDDPGEFLYRENEELKPFSGVLDSKMLTEWYKYRAHEIEQCSGQIDNALELVKLGQERGVKGLAYLRDDLITLSVLVYECQTDASVDLKSFQNLNNLEKMRLLLSKSTEKSFIRNFKEWAVPFLDRLEKRNRGSKTKLIQQYMIETAKMDLTFPLKILQQSASESTEPFIPDVARQMKMAIDCIYLCSRDDQLEEARMILKCFSSDTESVSSQQIVELREKLDELKLHLNGAEILSENGFAKPVSYLVDTKANKETATSLMLSLSSIAKHREPPLKPADWDNLLADMLKLRNDIFDVIPASICYEACVDCLLTSGNKENIKHAELVRATRDDGMEYHRFVELVVKASREYFNSANDVKDPCMNLAKACLDLVQPNEASVQEELDLITALSMFAEYNVSVLPLQVRLCQDKAELIEKSLDSSPASYKDPGKLLRLASLLQMSGSDEKTRRGRVLSLVAQRALDHDDFTVAYNTCAELVKTGYIPGWKICRTLGQNTEFTNLKARQKLLNFSLSHCEPNAIEALLHSRSLLQTEILYRDLSELMEEIGDPMDSDDLTAAGQITKTTKTILSNVSDVGWWSDTLQWVRPLHKPSEKMTNRQQKRHQKELEFHNHPFYETVHEKLAENENTVSWKTNKNSVHVSELLLQTQKIAEERAEGSIEEPATEVLIQLADECFLNDTPLAMAYLLSLPESTNAYECFEKLPNSALTLKLASYYYALQVYSTLSPQFKDSQASLYLHPPDHVVDHVINSLRDHVETGDDDTKFLMAHLKRYHTQLADFAQARLLQGLGRGVDINRFTQDEEYKKETILGLTMSADDKIFETAVSLAERYDISKWEMFMSHLEWLFTDGDLSTKQLQERVGEKDLMTTLLTQPEKMISRLQEYIYPSIDGKQLARLLYYFMLFNDCVQSGGLSYEDDLDPQMHIRLIKKIKASSQGVNYKSLIEGGDPLLTLRPHLLSSNVHVFAKMANKLRGKDGELLNPSQVFKVFAEKIFWEGERKTVGKEVDWIHRYEEVHSYLDRLTFSDLIVLIDSFTFSEQAINTLNTDLRDEILRRAVKFSRQRSAGGQRKKSKENIYEENGVTIAEVTQHFEQSLKHLASLDNKMILNFEESEQIQYVKYARLYDLSRSEPKKIKELCTQVLCNGDSLSIVKNLIELANQQRAQGFKTKDIVKESLMIVLKSYSSPGERPGYLSTVDSPFKILAKLLATLREHINDENKKLVKDEDILQEIRTFCADETVSPEVKHEVLQLIEKTVKLTGEDKTLLLFHQTQAIVHRHWQIELSIEDVESRERLHQLFLQIFGKTVHEKELLAVATLLSIWPPLEDEKDGEGAWYLVLSKMISQVKDGSSVVKIVREKADSIRLNKKESQHILNKLIENYEPLSGYKFGLLVGDEEILNFVTDQMKTTEREEAAWDNEFLELLYKNKLSSHIVETPYFNAYVNYLLKGEINTEHSRESRVNEVVRELHETGHTVQAASIKAALDNLHPGLRTLDNVLGTFLKWVRNS
ncbi:LOW QUALITY PROTEIN: neuroblastoma-amplified sequence-like [Dendronephthya gigantea]|uniref:LOW QUALITY PROTEIN: neuroblastoma-amplified sequence-like n=1 Tax=Dendronephthya gigantea TaxID=151771 RepID=UPI00106ABC6B|nr:LOW QUALITY PROTEIN: neuroblastoma-amplified sequence-like [Dendronephthya gigantea]